MLCRREVEDVEVQSNIHHQSNCKSTSTVNNKYKGVIAVAKVIPQL